MNDKELLELAAKAAGWNLEDFSSVFPSGFDTTAFFYKDEKGMTHPWNPLTDDGDALRLAVKLNLIIEFYQTYVYVYYSMSEKTFEEDHDGDPYAATRRAIVRAAAEIGKEMK